MKYFIQSLGYQSQVDFSSLASARQTLHEMVTGDLIDCKKRFGQACKVKNGQDNYTVKIGNAQSASIWSSHSIQKA